MPRILITSKDGDLRNILSSILRSRGHIVFTADREDAAAEAVTKESVDLVLLDISSIEGIGAAVYDRIRKADDSLRVVLLAGLSNKEVAEDVISRGVAGYLFKPFKVDELLNVIKKALQDVQWSADESTAAYILRSMPVPPEADGAAAASRARRKRMIAVGAGVLASAILGGVLLTSLPHRSPSGAEPAETLPVEYRNPKGLCWVGANLWICDWVSGTVYRHGAPGLTVVASYTTANSRPTGIAFDGKNVWTCNPSERRIYRHRPDSSLTVEADFPAAGTPTALYWDGTALWAMDTNAAKIYRYLPVNGLTPAGVYASPVPAPSGMARKGKDYYIGDYASGTVARARLRDGVFSVRGRYALPPVPVKDARIAGMALEEGTGMLWMTVDGSDLVARCPLDALRPLER